MTATRLHGLIPTRIHGLVDYGVAALLGALAMRRDLSPAVRQSLGTASAYHTGYSLLTNYEGGVRPALSMRAHLALDAVAGAALLGGGLTMRRSDGRGRGLLIAFGLAELAVVALSSTEPRQGPGDGGNPVTRLLGGTLPHDHAHAHDHEGPTYPPLDVPKPVTEDLLVVDSTLSGAAGKVVGARMTVIRLPDGGLLLHSPTRHTPALRTALEAIGPIRHLVAPNPVHWLFMKEWQDAVPEAVTWGPPGLRRRAQVRRSGLRLDRDLGASAPAEWGGAIELIPVPGGLGFREMALFHAPSRALVLTDLVMNLEPRKVPALLRPLTRLLGALAPDGMPPPWLRAVVRWQRPGAAAAARRMLALHPERVVFSHGDWFRQDGAAHLRRSLRWLVDGRDR